MDFLHTEFWGGEEHTVVVTVDGQCNVMLLDGVNFSSYRNGQGFTYYGGWAARSPVLITPPHQGHWHVVVDLGGRSGQVKAGVRIAKRDLGTLPLSE